MRALGAQAGWIVGPFAVQQAVRLATNIVLALMLSPEMFGIMLIINTLRTGLELMSDCGIGQSVVRSDHADDRRFLDTAWTLQLVRGALLTVIALLAAGPVGRAYGHGLESMLLVTSSVFLLTGLLSPGLFLNQREIGLRQRGIYELVGTVFQCGLTIVLAAYIPSAWALVWGLVFSTLFSTVASFAFRPHRLPRLAWDSTSVREILHFGKWIFISTAIYFASTSIDKAYLASVLAMSLVGTYSVARSFADMLGQLAQRASTFVIFPKIAQTSGRLDEAAHGLRRFRLSALTVLVLPISAGIAVSDAFILLLYDQRYSAAAFMLPILMFTTWFAITAAFAEATLLGCGKPAAAVAGNAGKFLTLAIGLPASMAWVNLTCALFVLAAAEMVRSLMLAWALARDELTSVWQECLLGGVVALLAIAIKLVLGLTGIVPGLADWWRLGVIVHG